MKVSKICTLTGFFCAMYITVDLKKCRGVILHDTEEWSKIWSLTCGLENDIRNLINFHQSSWNCQNWNPDGILLSNVENAWTKYLERSYVKNLKRNWLVISKLTWGIWEILPQTFQSSKNFHVTWLLLSKVYIVWAKKVQTIYLIWHGRVMQNLEKNWLVVWKKTVIWQIFTGALKSLKIGTLMGSSYPK